MTHRLEFLPILRIRLDPQTSREHELAYCSREAGEEGVEGLCAHTVPVSLSPTRLISAPRAGPHSKLKPARQPRETDSRHGEKEKKERERRHLT